MAGSRRPGGRRTRPTTTKTRGGEKAGHRQRRRPTLSLFPPSLPPGRPGGRSTRGRTRALILKGVASPEQRYTRRTGPVSRLYRGSYSPKKEGASVRLPRATTNQPLPLASSALQKPGDEA